MSDDVPRLGAEIRRLRRRQQMSQERLAALTGLSARTVSNLERGVIASPRASTVHLLASALGVDPDPRGEYTAPWAAADRPDLHDGDVAKSSVNFDDLLSSEARRARSSIALILWWTHATMNSEFRVAWIQTRRGVRSEKHTVDRVVYVYQHDSRDLAWDRVHLINLGNCREITRHVIPEHGMLVYELGLDAPLQAGETCMVEHTIDLSTALPATTNPDHEIRFGVGVRRSGVAVALKVTCAPDARPASTTYLWSDRAAGEPTVSHELQLSAAGVASVVLDQAGAGMHQIHLRSTL